MVKKTGGQTVKVKVSHGLWRTLLTFYVAKCSAQQHWDSSFQKLWVRKCSVSRFRAYMHTAYVTSLAYLLMLSQSQGGHFWHGRPARLCLCVQNKCTPVHTPRRSWSDSEIMAGGEEMEGKIERRKECENNDEWDRVHRHIKYLQTPSAWTSWDTTVNNMSQNLEVVS